MEIKQVWDLLQFRPEKMQKVNLFESPRMFCDIYCFEPGQEQKVHSHRGNDKIYHVLKGRGRFTVGDDTRTMEEGETTWAPSGEPHGVLNHSGEPLICLVVMAPHPKPGRFESPSED